ncbi:Leucine permease transcriptional regulator [Phaffia rhodozyma]|uniref:Leucine permease transcriptional regulator n=1 Tax=Phaffia rhodozyma TaxID=264483 RepID=A0A0F7SG54_PHARH|nr:Leucine permease transcriptional regulator [Phaffia rhodozyma]
MNNGGWPAPLKNWVKQSLLEAAPENKDKVQAELKKVIFDAYRNKTIDTTDWSNLVLDSIQQQRLRDQLSGTTRKPAQPIVSQANPTLIAAAASPSASPQTNNKRKKPEKESKKKTSNLFVMANTKAEEEANEKRKKRFARERDIELGRSTDQEMGVLNGTTNGGNSVLGGKFGKKGGKRFFGGGEEEAKFDPNVIDWDRQTIVGTCTKLEKKYLRLTSEPDPSTIRPLPILIQTLDLLKRKWREELNYPYICDQFKSMRQDLTVQRIKNYFTVQVYEIHARIALESKDLGELNQCQSALRQLYEHNIPGHPEEFLAYRILYLLYTRNKSETNILLARLTPIQRSPPCVKHALKVQKALATSNYHSFFKLFNEAPNMGAYMMDHFLDRERITALATMSKAYPSLPISFITEELAFEDPTETISFLRSHQIDRFVPPPATAPKGPRSDRDKIWDSKAAAAGMTDIVQKYVKVDIKGQL